MDEADYADLDNGTRVNAEIMTHRNLAAEVDKAIRGNGFCLECGNPVDPVETKLKVNGRWQVVTIYPRWCCPECMLLWSRDE